MNDRRNGNDNKNYRMAKREREKERADIEKKYIELARKKRARRTISRNFTIIMSLIILLFFVYAFGKLYNLSNVQSIPTLSLEKIDVRKSEFYSGVVIRDEHVYKSSEMGYVTYNARDLEKVKAGQLIFQISDEEEVKNLYDELDSINKNLFSLQKFREEYSMYKKDIDNIENDNKNIIDTWNMSSYKDIYTLSAKLNDNNNIRNQIIFSDTRVVDSGKQEARGLIENKIDTSVSKYYSNNGGITSYWLDGLEEKFTLETMDTITKDQSKMNSELMQLPEIIVSEEANVMRVVESNIWYIATYIPKAEAEHLQVGNDKTIYIAKSGNLKEINTVIHKLSDSGEDVFIIFEIRNYMLDFINDRNVEVTLKNENFENIKIPASAIVEKEMIEIPVEYIVKTDKNVVIRQSELGTTTAIPIKIDSYDAQKENAYLSKLSNELKLGDVLISVGETPKTFELKNYNIIKGVYKVNNGTSKFEKININENLDNSGEFVYILPSANLKEYDRIALDATEIKENQLIY